MAAVPFIYSRNLPARGVTEESKEGRRPIEVHEQRSELRVASPSFFAEGCRVPECLHTVYDLSFAIVNILWSEGSVCVCGGGARRYSKSDLQELGFLSEEPVFSSPDVLTTE